jgi:hypothetical protein
MEAQTVVANDKMNVLYLGIPNPIVIAAMGYASSEIEVSSDNGTIEKVGNKLNTYTITPIQQGNSSIILTYKGNKIGEHLFRIKKIPDPTATIFLPRLAPKNSKCGNTGFLYDRLYEIVLLYDDFHLDIPVKCEVLSFEFTQATKNTVAKKVMNKGAMFSTELKEIIEESSLGDSMTFDDIRVQCPCENNERKLLKLFFTLK